jgi:hypothetical protein
VQLGKVIGQSIRQVDWQRSFYLNLICHSSFSLTVAICRYVGLCPYLLAFFFTYLRRTIANQLSVECENIVGAGNHLVKKINQGNAGKLEAGHI